MKYYLITVMEERFGIFPPGAYEIFGNRAFDFEPVFLSPSEKYEFSPLLCEGKMRREFFYEYLAAALKAYFFKVRKLPRMEIETPHSVLNFTLKNTDKILINLRKCKYKFSKISSEINGVTLNHLACRDALIFRAENVSDFDENILPTALLKQKELYTSALAYSRNGSFVNIKRSGRISSVECAAVLSELFILEEGGRKYSEIDFSFSDGLKMSLKNIDGSLFEAALEVGLLGFFDAF